MMKGRFSNPNLIKIWIALAAILTGTGCSKTEDFEDLDLLLNKEWQLAEVARDGNPVNDTCHLDDVLVFENTEDFDYRVGSSLCDESEAQRTPSSWKMREKFTVIRLDYKVRFGASRATISEYWEIQELTENTLVLRDDGTKNVITKRFVN
ncbi:MAG: lipocalin family protein [Phaeodactylibacter sp.]|nr:lipocalin family protein [Phaeodactylibacter sp.]